MKITTKRFIECIKNWNTLIKKSNNSKIFLENYWATNHKQKDVFGMFFDFEYKNKKEYVKIYLDNKLYNYPNLKIEVYLLNKGENNIYGKTDLLIKTFSDFKKFEEFFCNIQEELLINIQERMGEAKAKKSR